MEWDKVRKTSVLRQTEWGVIKNADLFFPKKSATFALGKQFNQSKKTFFVEVTTAHGEKSKGALGQMPLFD